jgi:hypothetical protein
MDRDSLDFGFGMLSKAMQQGSKVARQQGENPK